MTELFSRYRRHLVMAGGSAALAAPSTGGAVRRTSSTPSRVPATPGRAARGITRTSRITAMMALYYTYLLMRLGQFTTMSIGGAAVSPPGTSSRKRTPSGETCQRSLSLMYHGWTGASKSRDGEPLENVGCKATGDRVSLVMEACRL